MSSYPTPPEQPPRPPVEQPQPIRTSMMIVWGIVAMSVVNVVLTFVYLDELVAAAGLDLSQSQQDATRVGAIVGAVFFGVVFGALWIVMGIFLGKGKNWARIVLTILAALGVLNGLFGLAADRPAVLAVAGIITLLLEIALLFFMWKKESSAFLQAR